MTAPDDSTTPPPASRRRSSRLLPGLLVLLVIVILFRTVSERLSPAPPVPVPAHMEALQPQLRDYIQAQVEWVERDPRQMERHATLGIVYAANQLWREALASFQNAATLRPREPLAHLYTAIATQEIGDQEGALQLFRELSRRFPAFPQGLHRHGETALRAGLLEEASDVFERLVEVAPDEWRGHAGLGEIELRRGQSAQAAEHLERAVALDPQALNARSLLGLAYRGLGRMEEAEFQLRLGQDSQSYPMPDPWGDTAHQHMRLIQDQVEVARGHSMAGHHDRAIGMLLEALSYDQTNLALMNNLAIALNRADRPDHALQVVHKIREFDSNNLSALITASMAAHALGEMDQALNWADRAVAQSPETTQAHLARANALLGQRRDEDALEALLAAARCDPRDAEIQMEIGDLLVLNFDRPDEALVHYQRASRLNPILSGAPLRLARLHIERFEFDEARREIDRLRLLDPAHPGLPLLEEQHYARSPPRSATAPGRSSDP
jgi:tetratricopeptide (TPR) repeat protein